MQQPLAQVAVFDRKVRFQEETVGARRRHLRLPVLPHRDEFPKKEMCVCASVRVYVTDTTSWRDKETEE